MLAALAELRRQWDGKERLGLGVRDWGSNRLVVLS